MIAAVDWVTKAKRVFVVSKPEHFTNHLHCDECAEHDEILRTADIESIGLDKLGNPGWDPMCFCSAEGKRYFMPALIRLSLQSIDDDFYVAQLLFHLGYDGLNNALYQSCNEPQRRFIAHFVEHLIINYTLQLENNGCQDDALRVHEIWSGV